MKVVAIGASAGGVESLKRLCRGLDPDINAAFCVVLARRLSERAHGRDQTLAARQFDERAADVERDADAIRAVLGGTSANGVTLDGDRLREAVTE